MGIDRTPNRAARIESAPETSREHLLGVVFGSDEHDDDGVTKNTLPRAEEWIDLADAGPYIDETTVPIFSPNGDGSGGVETYGDPVATAKWVAAQLNGLPRVGGDSPVLASDADGIKPALTRDTE